VKLTSTKICNFR